MVLFDRSYMTYYWSTIRMLGYGFLFTFYSNRGCILSHSRANATNWSKITIISYPASFDAVSGWVSHWNIAIPFGMEKLEWCGYQTVKKKIVLPCFDILTKHRRVMI